MLEVLDVHGLKKDQIQFLQQLVEFMRAKQPEPTLHLEDETQTIKLRSWAMGETGNISREEIYDYLDEQ